MYIFILTDDGAILLHNIIYDSSLIEITIIIHHSSLFTETLHNQDIKDSYIHSIISFTQNYTYTPANISSASIK